jgi:PAS domain S-box-containing protein
MSITRRLTVLLSGVALASVLVLTVFMMIESRRSSESTVRERRERRERGALLDRLVQLRSKPLSMITSTEYAIWNEMVDFVHHPDSSWAETNLDYLLTSYQFSADWVFDTAFNLVYAAQDSQAQGLDTILNVPHLRSLFAQGHLCRFFLATPAGPIEIQGGTIHPTIDTDRRTPAQGYLLAGRLWNQDHLLELGQLLGGRARVAGSPDSQPGSSRPASLLSLFRPQREFSLNRPLAGWDGNPVAWLQVKTTNAEAVTRGQHALLLFCLMLGFASLLVVVLAVSLGRWVHRPLTLLSRSLGSGDGTVIQDLARARTEFGELARLLYRFLDQQAELQRENAERRAAQSALHESETRYRALVENMGEGVAIVDSDQKFLFVNRAAGVIYGLEPAELIGRSPWDFVEPEHQHIRAEQLANRRRGTGGDYEIAIARPDDSRRTIHVTGTPRFDSSGVFLGSIAVFRDVTDENRTREELERYRHHLEELVAARTRELEQAQRENVRREKLGTLGQVAGSVAHELRNPLGIIRNAAYLMKLTGGDQLPEPAARQLKVIDGQVERSDRIIAELLDFTQARPPERKNVLLTALLDAALAEFELPEHTVLERRLPAGEVRLFVDSTQIVRALANVVQNAIQAMPSGGRLTLSAAVPTGTAAVKIADTGCGIAPEHLSHVFEPLFSTKVVGVGLGLPVALNYVQQNGGRLDIQSDWGKGTTVTITLPTAAPGIPPNT